MTAQHETESADQRIAQLQISRRRLLSGLVAAGLVGPVLAACGGSNNNKGSSAGGANNKGASTLATPQAPSAAPNTGGAASPAAAVAGGSPAAGVAAPSTIGKLTVRTEPYPSYSGTPTDTAQLTIIRAEDLSAFNPTALNSYSPYTFVYDPLVWIDEYTLDPKPWLATSWTISPDGKSYTFKLRNDVKWHDGTPFTADDVAWSFIAYRDDPDSSVARFFPLMQKDPVVVDPQTIRFDLSDTSGDWILNACNQFIMQKAQFIDFWNQKKSLKDYPYTDKMLIGTGAWKQTKYAPGDSPPNVQYARNDNYWVGKPHFQKFIFQEVDKAEARITAWLNGSTDLLWPVSATDVDQVKNQDAWLYDAYAVAFMNAWINFKSTKQDHPDFLQNKQVRQALSTGIDRKGYAQAIFKGFVDETKIGSIAFPWAYNTNLKSPDYDQAKAQQMLADAGYKKDSSGALVGQDGKPIKLIALLSTTNQYPVDKIAVSVQEDFRKLGIDMQIDTQEPQTVKNRRLKVFDWDLWFTSRVLFAGFSDYSYYKSDWDPRTKPAGLNAGAWNNPQADKLLDQIIREPDLQKQKDLLWQFQQVIADDLPALWFGFPRDLILVKKNFLGYQPNAMWQYWDTWKLWKSG
ncbi:MAG TPA: peptide ABC transporter substrate-binding protein [Dehalococcoidia bacterium]|nr:peptide ABC transporter substrate-binding protein [Dehalococcoidia bacterium]